MSWLDEVPRFDIEELKRNRKVLAGDAPPDIKTRTTPFVIALCKEFDVGVDECGIYSAPYKVGRTIFLDTTVSPERQNWAFCHELAHILLNHTESTHPSPEEEFAANQLAAELLLPTELFSDAVRYATLAELKQDFPQASWEVLLRRRLQFRYGIGTIFDEGKMTFRNASPGLAFPPQPLPQEWKVARDSFNQSKSLSLTTGEYTITADFVDTGNGIRRVLLWTEKKNRDDEF